MEVADLQNLLNNLPRAEATTFLDISGFPNRENVWSNILSFYFTRNNKHQLHDMLIRSLLKCVPDHDIPYSSNDTVFSRREVVTATGRIDIVLVSSNYIIAIENKTKAELVNPLIEYEEFIRNTYHKKHNLFLVLSINNETANLLGGFKNVTYDALVNEIIEELKGVSHYDIRNNTYHQLFQQFILTIQKTSNYMSDSEVDFMIKNAEKLNHLIELEQAFFSYRFKKMERIWQAVRGELTGGPQPDDGDIWILFCYTVNEFTHKLECVLFRDGMLQITISDKINQVNESELKNLELFKSNQIDSLRTNGSGKLIIAEFTISTPDEEIILKLKEILEQFKVNQ